MTDKKEMNLEEMEKVNGGNAIKTLDKVVKIGKKVIDTFTGTGSGGDAKPAAPTTDKSVKNNKAGGNQNINSGEFTQNKNSSFGG